MAPPSLVLPAARVRCPGPCLRQRPLAGESMVIATGAVGYRFVMGGHNYRGTSRAQQLTIRPQDTECACHNALVRLQHGSIHFRMEAERWN